MSSQKCFHCETSFITRQPWQAWFGVFWFPEGGSAKSLGEVLRPDGRFAMCLRHTLQLARSEQRRRSVLARSPRREMLIPFQFRTHGLAARVVVRLDRFNMLLIR